MSWTLHLHGESTGPDAGPAEDSIRDKVRELFDLVRDHGAHRVGGSFQTDSGVQDNMAHDPAPAATDAPTSSTGGPGGPSTDPGTTAPGEGPQGAQEPQAQDGAPDAAGTAQGADSGAQGPGEGA